MLAVVNVDTEEWQAYLVHGESENESEPGPELESLREWLGFAVDFTAFRGGGQFIATLPRR